MIEAAFPGTSRNGAVDRAALSQAVAGDPAALAAAGRPDPSAGGGPSATHFWQAQPTRRLWCWIFPCCWKPAPKVDAVVVATRAATMSSAQRVLARPGMTEDKFARPAGPPDAATRKSVQRRIIVVMTDKGLDHAREQVKMILAATSGDRNCDA